jgi:asparagine synthase (glutamine-hydrolysing)
MYDEPFADSSQIPTYLVSRFAREQVTVALTGDGGDELFGGYNRHVLAPRLWEQMRKVPRPLRAMAGSPLGRVPPQVWSGAARLMHRRAQPRFGASLHKALNVAATATTFDEIYGSFRDEWSFAGSPVPDGEGGLPFDLDLGRQAANAARMMYCDAVTYLPDDVLCKVDRASMAVSLETRVPFLDDRVAEVAARIPLSMKIRDGRGKYILRKLLDRYVPSALVDRPKAGFAVPVGEWIRGPLRGWAEELLDPRSLRAAGWFDADAVSARWSRHLSGREDATAALWAVLMFQAWLREQTTANAAAA